MINVLTILLSGLFSSLLAFIVWNIQKKKEFLWDYKKYILKKRQDAYDDVQKIIHLCLLKKTMTGKNQYNSFFESQKAVKDFIQFTELVQSGWVSDEVITILGELKGIATKGIDLIQVEDADHAYDDEGKEILLTESEVIMNYGLEKLSEIEKLNIKLQEVYIHDLKQLGDIDKFTKPAK